MDAPLLDRIYAELHGRTEPTPAAEIARTFLRLTRGPSAEGLVRQLIGRDPRFQEIFPGAWEARAIRRATLAERVLRLAVAEAEGDRPAPWRVHTRLWSAGDLGPVEVLLPDAPHPWEEERLEGARPRWTSHGSGSLLRALHWMERQWGVELLGEPPLDLGLWARVLLAGEGVRPSDTASASTPEQLAGRWSLGPLVLDGPGGQLEFLSRLIEALVERSDDWDDETLEREAERRLGRRPIPWERFAFDAAWLQRVPDLPGIYRFRDRSGSLLYVGKARSLRARLASYFRPLPPEPSRRERLLFALDRIEIETTATELDAFVRESEAIRREAPRWNVQVEVHASERTLPPSRWPLAFTVPGTVDTASSFVLESPERGLALEGDVLRALGSQEARLVLRYFIAHEDSLVRLERIGDALLEDWLAARSPRPAPPSAPSA